MLRTSKIFPDLFECLLLFQTNAYVYLPIYCIESLYIYIKYLRNYFIRLCVG